MKIRFLPILKYFISLLVAISIFAYIYQGQDLPQMFRDFLQAKWGWILLSISISLLSHFFRAWRWSLMLKPLGYHIGVFTPYLAVMVGYFANFIVPRMGEVTRCTILQRTNQIPFQQSFGAVIAERAFDFVCLIIVTILAVLLEFDKLESVLNSVFSNQTSQSNNTKWIILIIMGVSFIVALLTWILLKEKIKQLPIYQKIMQIMVGVKDGFLSVLRLSRIDRFLFLVQTITIWVLYLLTFYVLFFSLEATSVLDIHCALAGLAMSGVAIVAPVQGGIGVYHYLISKTLITYGITETTAKYFAFMSHNSQIIMFIGIGSICLLISLLISKNNKKNA
ncbi:MAG: flippase-like domain-containing protein [Thermoflexibacter sp.]|jgi:hypothetical protein|nr:flippase-like domain-containing protein [Thermoflexibacter sp.]